MGFYGASGIVAIVGAFLDLPGVFAAIVSVFLLAWSASWASALRRMSQETRRQSG
jgi:hypothetical protein